MKPFSEIDWGMLECAYHDAAASIPIQLAEIQSAQDEEKIRFFMGELISNVNHQCDFYDSTMVVISYLAAFARQRQEELSYAMTLLSYLATFYSTEAPVPYATDDIRKAYEESLVYAKAQLLCYVRERFPEVCAFARSHIDLSLSAFLAIADGSPANRMIARQLCFGNFDEIPVLCAHCGFEDETLPQNNAAALTPAAAVSASWEPGDFSEIASYLPAIYGDAVYAHEIQWTLTMAGTFTCPDCGQAEQTCVCAERFMREC